MLQILILDNDYDSPSIKEDVTNLSEQVQIETGLHGGMLSLSFKMGASLLNAYRWYDEYITYRVLVIDHEHRLIFDGRLEDAKLEPGQIEATAFGPWIHMADQFYQDSSSWLATGQAKDIIEDMITVKCPNISTNFTNIEDTNFDVYPQEYDDYENPRQIVEQLASLGDDQTPPREWFFAVWPGPMQGPIPSKPIPYFFPKPEGTVTWYTYLGELAVGQQALSLARSSKRLFNKMATVYSDTVGSRAITEWAEDADSQAKYGLREGILSIGGSTSLVAAGARDQALEECKEPSQSSTILMDGSIYDSAGRRHYLWEIRAGDVIRIQDLVPTDISFDEELDALRTFFIKATRYSADDNRLALTPDYHSPGLDVLLARAGLAGGRLV